MLVVFRLEGGLYLANIVPLSRISSPLPSKCMGGEVPVVEGLVSVFLTARGKQDIVACLRAQGADPEQFIIPASVHKSKAILWQGVVFATCDLIDITEHANPFKPIPSREEVERLWRKLVDTEGGEMT